MEDSVLAAMKKWPNVKAAYGWLRLDRRGRWFLRNRRIDLPNTLKFINNNYQSDMDGRWFFQNGPQRVFVDLEATPYIFNLSGNELIAHTGQKTTQLQRVLLDEQGSLTMVTDLGPGLLLDSDLDLASERFCHKNGDKIGNEELEELVNGNLRENAYFEFSKEYFLIEPVTFQDLHKMLHFVKKPREKE